MCIVYNYREGFWFCRRRSKLEIPEPTQDDFGTYECVARGVDGTAVSRSIEVLGPPAAPQNSFSEPVSTSELIFFLFSGAIFLKLFFKMVFKNWTPPFYMSPDSFSCLSSMSNSTKTFAVMHFLPLLLSTHCALQHTGCRKTNGIQNNQKLC